jgi:hypothetical protein
LRRRRRAPAIRDQPRPDAAAQPLALALAVTETVAVLATGLVLYLSVNAVTHPATLRLRATHFAAWPTEGTLRVMALLLCVCSVTALRYLLARPTAQRTATG